MTSLSLETAIAVRTAPCLSLKTHIYIGARDGGHLTARVFVEQPGDAGADAIVLKSHREALRVDADGERGNPGQRAVVLHALRNALRMTSLTSHAAQTTAASKLSFTQ